MSVTSIQVGNPLPKIAEVRPLEGLRIYVRWVGEVEGKTSAEVDLAPTILTYKFYRPLREDRVLFESVRIIDGGSALAWGHDDDLDMAAAAVARLAAETMEPADFAAFLKRRGFTFDRAAAELGISRRLVAYYASERAVPRHIALACAYIDLKAQQAAGRQASTQNDNPTAFAEVAERVRATLRRGAKEDTSYSFTRVNRLSGFAGDRIAKEDALRDLYSEEYRPASRH